MHLKLTPSELRLLIAKPVVTESDGTNPTMQLVIDGHPIGDWVPMIRGTIQRFPVWDELITMNMSSRFEIRVN